MQTVALLAGIACAKPSTQQPSPAADPAGRAADRAVLLRLHERQRTAHLQRQAAWLVEEWGDSLFSVSRGRVSVATPEAGRANFQEYLDGVTFQQWDDIVPPRIRISPDGQMAYVIVEKRGHLTQRGPGGAAIASTERPDSIEH